MTNSPWYSSLTLASSSQTSLCLLTVIRGVPSGGMHHDPENYVVKQLKYTLNTMQITFKFQFLYVVIIYPCEFLTHV